MQLAIQHIYQNNTHLTKFLVYITTRENGLSLAQIFWTLITKNMPNELYAIPQHFWTLDQVQLVCTNMSSKCPPDENRRL